MAPRIVRSATAQSTARRAIVIGAAAGIAARATALLAGNSAAAESDDMKMRTFLHQEVELDAPRARIYEILLDSAMFSAFSGEHAEIDSRGGGAFSMFGARIVGRNVELVPAARIVQAWRPAHWEPGVYSIVKFAFAADAGKTKLVLDHTGFPQGEFASLSSGWNTHYWQRLKKYLA